MTTAHEYWQAYDASNRSAGEAGYWLACALLATGERRDAESAFVRAR